jgi:hypothetical protein
MSLIDRCKDNLFPNILFNKNLQELCQSILEDDDDIASKYCVYSSYLYNR